MDHLLQISADPGIFYCLKQFNRSIDTFLRRTSVSAHSFCNNRCLAVFFGNGDSFCFFYIQIAFHYHGTSRCYDILCRTSLDGKDFDIGWIFYLFCYFPERLSFLAKDDRELSVRCKSNRRFLSACLIVMTYTGRTILLVGSENDTDSSVDFKIQVPNRFQCVNRADHRALVIQDTPSVHLSVVDLASKRRVFPAFSKWNDIKVTQDCRHLLTVSIFDPAHFIVQVASLKSKLLPQRQCVIQSLFRPSSIWCVLFRSALDALDRNTFFEGGKNFIFKLHHFFIQFFISHCYNSFR